MRTSKLDTFPGPMAPRSGLELFFACQTFAKRYYRSSQGQAMRPGGARIFYYTRLRLLRLGVLPAVEPTTTELPEEVVQRFLQEAPNIAARLAADFGQAMRLYQQPEQQLQRLLAASPFLQPPEVHWAPEHMRGSRHQLYQSWRQFWEHYWNTLVQDHREELLKMLRPDRLPVVVVARPSDSPEKALAYLQERIAVDQNRWPSGPPEEVYLYDEPLAEWLLRPFLTGSQLLHLFRSFATWLNTIPGIIQHRRSRLEQESKRTISDSASRHPTASQAEPHPPMHHPKEPLAGPAELPGELRRRLPLPPNGTATGEALFYFSVCTWKHAHKTERAKKLLPDGTLLEPETFRALIVQAVCVAEFLLWDEPQAVRLRAGDVGNLHQALHEALLPGWLRQEYRTLLTKSRAYEQKHALPHLPWPEWETALGTITRAVAARLAATLIPAALTREQLDTLLAQPLPPQRGPYLYDRPFGAWCQAAFPAQMPGGRQLLAWCRSLAETLGSWPAGIAGVPSSPEAAARAIFWFTKLAVEARLGPTLLREVASSPSLPLASSPQRADGGLAIWLDDPLPVAALSLASVFAPQVARVLHRMVSQAEHQAQPLLLAQLKAGDPKSWAGLEHFLKQHARSLGHPDPERAAWEATEKLQAEFLYLLLPSDISEGLLAGERSLLQMAGWFDGSWYQQKQSSYHCLGDLFAFARSFIRLPRSGIDRLEEEMLPSQAPEMTSQAPEIAAFEAPLMEGQEAHRALQLLTEFASAEALGTLTGPSRSGLTPHQNTWFRLLSSSQTAQSIIADLARQHNPTALALQQHLEKPLSHLTEEQPGKRRKKGDAFPAGQLAQELVLARLLSEPRVQASPQMRRALTDLLELPRGLAPQKNAAHLPVGVLERVGALAFRPPWRAEVLKALEALGRLAEKQRQAIISRLLKQEEFVVLLALLEASGWKRPTWLPQPDIAEPSGRRGNLESTAGSLNANTLQQHDKRGKGHSSVSPEKEHPSGSSVQLFHIGRMNWLKHLKDAHPLDGWRARGLSHEWLGSHLHSGLGKGTKHGQTLALYQITLAALPESLRLVVGAAWQLARKARLAQLPEILGMAGALPPQLPIQLDTPAFFAALHDFLLELPPYRSRQPGRLEAGQEELAAHRLRRQLQVARCRTYLWLLGVAGLQHDHERRAVLAAAALANGNPQRFERWLQGPAPSWEEANAMCKQIQQWHHQITLTPDALPAYLHSAGQQVAHAWAHLRREVEARRGMITP